MSDARIFGNPPFLTMVIGAKNSGKSELVRYITYVYASSFAYVVCISPTSLNGFYQTFLPLAHIHDTYSDEIVSKIIAKQETLKKAGKPCQMLLILDDILASPDIQFEKRKASILNKLFAANRHWGISLLIVAQKLKGLPKLCRENADFVCITRCMRSAWGDILAEYGNMDKAEFFKLLEECTTDYKVLMYKANVSRSSDHFSCFKIPADFLSRKFRLQY